MLVLRAYELVDTVSGILSDDTVALGLDDRFDLVSNLPVQHAGLTHGDRALGSLFRGGDKGRIFLAHLPDWVGCVYVSVETCK